MKYVADCREEVVRIPTSLITTETSSCVSEEFLLASFHTTGNSGFEVGLMVVFGRRQRRGKLNVIDGSSKLKCISYIFLESCWTQEHISWMHSMSRMWLFMITHSVGGSLVSRGIQCSRG